MSRRSSHTGKKPNLNNLRIFGSRVLIKNKKKSLKKLDSKIKEGIFLGYNEENKTFRIWDIERKEVIFSRDITVKESESIDPNLENEEKQEDEVFVEIEGVPQSGDLNLETSIRR